MVAPPQRPPLSDPGWLQTSNDSFDLVSGEDSSSNNCSSGNGTDSCSHDIGGSLPKSLPEPMQQELESSAKPGHQQSPPHWSTQQWQDSPKHTHYSCAKTSIYGQYIGSGAKSFLNTAPYTPLFVTKSAPYGPPSGAKFCPIATPYAPPSEALSTLNTSLHDLPSSTYGKSNQQLQATIQQLKTTTISSSPLVINTPEAEVVEVAPIPNQSLHVSGLHVTLNDTTMCQRSLVLSPSVYDKFMNEICSEDTPRPDSATSPSQPDCTLQLPSQISGQVKLPTSPTQQKTADDSSLQESPQPSPDVSPQLTLTLSPASQACGTVLSDIPFNNFIANLNSRYVPSLGLAMHVPLSRALTLSCVSPTGSLSCYREFKSGSIPLTMCQLMLTCRKYWENRVVFSLPVSL